MRCLESWRRFTIGSLRSSKTATAPPPEVPRPKGKRVPPMLVQSSAQSSSQDAEVVELRPEADPDFDDADLEDPMDIIATAAAIVKSAADELSAAIELDEVRGR
jgi:hypothetical protein